MFPAGVHYTQIDQFNKIFIRERNNLHVSSAFDNIDMDQDSSSAFSFEFSGQRNKRNELWFLDDEMNLDMASP